MPELPEVETVKRGLAKLLPSRIIVKITHDWPKSFPNAETDVQKFLVGAKILSIKRRAKLLLIELDSNYSLVIHLKMTGQLVYVGEKHFGAGHPSESLVGNLPDKSTRVTLTLDNGAKLFFNDQRKFGWVKLLPTIELPYLDFYKKIGPEPLSASFTCTEFSSQLRKRPNSSVKAVLLDQTIVAGIGNIYADEALWGAKIHPITQTKDLSVTKIKVLFKELQYVLKLSIKKGGSSSKNYVNANGKKGSYIIFARVYRRQGQPCFRCKAVIIKIRLAGRGTHVCPKCQKITA